MSKGRYDVQQKDDFVDRLPFPPPSETHSVVIRDRETGQEFKGSSTTVERAEQRVWEKVAESNKK